MSTEGINIRPPKPLVLGNDPTSSWKLWKTQYEFFEVATQLTAKTNEIQAATFMGVMGAEGIPIFESFCLTTAEKRNITLIKQKFESYFTPKAKIPYLRFIFNKMIQEEGESFDDFITKIKIQGNKCEYDTLKDDLIRDRIIAGVRSNQLREKLLSESIITLQRAIELGRAHEQALKEIHAFQSSEITEPIVAAVKKYNKRKSTSQTKTCGRCGNQHNGDCPAVNSKCRKCEKKDIMLKFADQKRNYMCRKLRLKKVANPK